MRSNVYVFIFVCNKPVTLRYLKKTHVDDLETMTPATSVKLHRTGETTLTITTEGHADDVPGATLEFEGINIPSLRVDHSVEVPFPALQSALSQKEAVAGGYSWNLRSRNKNQLSTSQRI